MSAIYDVCISGNVTGTFRVIADSLEDASRKANLMFTNGIDHTISGMDTLWSKPVTDTEYTKEG